MPDSTSAWAVYSILFPNQTVRDSVQVALRDQQIASAVYYPRALHQQPAYAGSHDGQAMPVAESLGARILALPIHPDLTDAQALRVTAAIRAALAA